MVSARDTLVAELKQRKSERIFLDKEIFRLQNALKILGHGSKSFGSIKDTILEAVKVAGSTFSTKDIQQLVYKNNSGLSKISPAMFTVTLGKAVDKGELTILRRGSGRRPTTYRKKGKSK